MIDPEKVSKVAEIFVGHFINMTTHDDPNFLELLIGFMYAHNKILSSLERLEIIPKDTIEKVKMEINAINSTDKLDKIFRKEEENGGSK